MKAIWLNDIHLNFLEGEKVYTFLDNLRVQEPDAVLIGGDIGEANDFPLYLQEMAAVVDRPIHFVLGNHDFYRGMISGVQAKAETICRENPNLHWLSRMAPVTLTEQVGLIGHDGWGDGRSGDYPNSRIPLNDFRLIGDFLGLDIAGRLKLLNRLGDQAAAHVSKVLPGALAQFNHVIVLTHVAPFQEAAWHEGQMSGPDWLPFMTCKAMGDVLIRVMAEHADRHITVLCGHTHGGGQANVGPNIHVLTGSANYGDPFRQLNEPERWLHL